eukprot:tig00000073_g1699.t1
MTLSSDERGRTYNGSEIEEPPPQRSAERAGGLHPSSTSARTGSTSPSRKRASEESSGPPTPPKHPRNDEGAMRPIDLSQPPEIDLDSIPSPRGLTTSAHDPGVLYGEASSSSAMQPRFSQSSSPPHAQPPIVVDDTPDAVDVRHRASSSSAASVQIVSPPLAPSSGMRRPSPGTFDSDEESALPAASSGSLHRRLNDVTVHDPLPATSAERNEPSSTGSARRVSFSFSHTRRPDFPQRGAAPEQARRPPPAPEPPAWHYPEAIDLEGIDDSDEEVVVTGSALPPRPRAPRASPPASSRPPGPTLPDWWGAGASSRRRAPSPPLRGPSPPRRAVSPPVSLDRARRSPEPAPDAAGPSGSSSSSSSSSRAPAAASRLLPSSFSSRSSRDGRPSRSRRTPSPQQSPPAAPAGGPGTEDDEALARRLMEEEMAGFGAAGGPAGSGRPMTDEELARHLQEEEERAAARARAHAHALMGHGWPGMGFGRPRHAPDMDDFFDDDGIDTDSRAGALSDALDMGRNPFEVEEIERRIQARRSALAAAAAAAAAGGGGAGGSSGAGRARHRYGDMMRAEMLRAAMMGGLGLPFLGGRAGGGSGPNAHLLSLSLVDRDFTADDYEMLLRLDEANNSKKGADKRAIERLPESTLRPGDEPVACCICMCDAEPGELIRRLHCAHAFHRDCVDKWLQINKHCPVCKIPID